MERIQCFLKKNNRLFIIFLFSFLIYTFLGFYINNGDPTASYGFAHAIKNGEIIYRDFNTISTPLYAFYSSILLFVYDDFIMFILSQCILVTMMFYFLFELFDKKAYIVLLSMIIFKYFGFLATYSFCCLALSVVVLFLEEKYPMKDYEIGFVLGLMFLSKQTVGGMFFLISLILCRKEGKRIFKRLLGFMIPCLLLLLYLGINKALYAFIDLCFLGLFDFGQKNNYLFTIWFFISFLLLVFLIYLAWKKKRKTDYYGLMYYIFLLPIFDLNHFAFFLVGFTITCLFHVNISSKKHSLLLYGLIIEFTIFNTLMGIRENRPIFYQDVPHFQYKYNYQRDYQVGKKLSSFIDQYQDKDPILIMYYSMNYNISHDRKITYFDVFLYGNHGIHGTEKMIKKISDMKNQYFIIHMKEYETAKKENNQFNDKIVEYIIANAELVDSKDSLSVYYKK